MTKSELRLAVLKLVWPDGADRRNADPAYYLPKAAALEDWILAGGHSIADPQQTAKRGPGIPRKSSPIPDTSTTPAETHQGPSQ